MTLLGLILIMGGWSGLARHVQEAWLLQTEGIHSTAHVLSKTYLTSAEAATYQVQFTFPTVLVGQPVTLEHTATVPLDFYYAVAPGDPLEIVYARSNPHLVRIVDVHNSNVTPYGWLVLMLGGMTSLLIGLTALNTYRQGRQLDSQGVMATVTILNLATRASGGCIASYVVYELPGIGPIRHPVNPVIFKSLRVGDHLPVIYLPHKPNTFRLQ